MHEAAAKHVTPSISPLIATQKKSCFNFVELLWYGRSWPRSQPERGKSNLECKKNTFILSHSNELVDIFSPGMEMPCLFYNAEKCWFRRKVQLRFDAAI